MLNNWEHLIEAVAPLTQTLLTRCAQITLRATRREALHVQGEQTWPVPALSLNGDAASPAVALFVDWAQQVAAGFVPDEHAQAVAEICRRLDCIPLCIELAVARVLSMSPGDAGGSGGRGFATSYTRRDAAVGSDPGPERRRIQRGPQPSDQPGDGLAHPGLGDAGCTPRLRARVADELGDMPTRARRHSAALAD